MESVEKSKYLRVKGQRIVVSDAVYQETVKQIHRTRYVARLENRCGQTNFRKCAGDNFYLYCYDKTALREQQKIKEEAMKPHKIKKNKEFER